MKSPVAELSGKGAVKKVEALGDLGDDRVQIYVRDNDPGIAHNNLEKIF